MTIIILQVAPFMAGFLCLLNVVFVYAFRKKRMAEILSYIVVGVLEVGIFVFVLGLRLSLIHRIPFHIPNYLPFTRTDYRTGSLSCRVLASYLCFPNTC